MTGADMFRFLRERLQPFNQPVADFVKMQIQHNAGYLPGEEVRAAINSLEHRTKLAAMGLDELNDLEKFAAFVLLDCAGYYEYRRHEELEKASLQR